MNNIQLDVEVTGVLYANQAEYEAALEKENKDA